jgi:hypothetical protein
MMTKERLRALRVNRKLHFAACLALRSWIRADKPELASVEHERLLSEARLQTGRAVDLGLLLPANPDREED